MAFNDDGTELAIGVSGGTQLWKAADGHLTLQTTLRSCGADTLTTAVAFMPGRDFLAVGDASPTSFTASGCVQLRDTAGGTVTNATVAEGASSVAFSPDGHTLAVGTSDGASLWDTSGGLQLRPAGTILPGQSVGAVAFSPNGMTLAAGSRPLTGDGAASVRLWNATTFRPEGKQLSLTPGTGVSSLAFSPDSRLLAESGSGPHNGPAQLWAVATGKSSSLPLAGAAENAVTGVAFDPRQPASTVAVATDDGTELWNAPAVVASLAQALPADIDADGTVARFGPGGRLLAVTDPGGGDAILVLNAATRKLVAAIPAGSGLRASTVQDLAFSPSGSVLTVLSIAGSDGSDGSDGSVQRWQLTGGAPRQLGAAIAFPVLAGDDLAGGWLSPGGGTLVVPAAAGLELLNLVGGGPRQAVFGPKDATFAQFSADGELGVTAAGETRLWDVTTRRPASATIATGGNPWTLSPDGATLALDTGTIGIGLWNTATGESLGVSLSDTDLVSGLAFSANGQILAALGEGGVQLWDIATGQSIGTLPAAGGVMSFDPAGTGIALASMDGLQLWAVALTPQVAAADLCPQAGQTLSRGQWAQYAPGVPYQDVCRANPDG
jgi:WD40 repeat protein